MSATRVTGHILVPFCTLVRLRENSMSFSAREWNRPYHTTILLPNSYSICGLLVRRNFTRATFTLRRVKW